MKSEDIKLTDEEMGEIAKQYDGIDCELSKKVGMPVYKNLGDEEGKHRAIVQAELKKVVEYLIRRSVSFQPEGEGAIFVVACDIEQIKKIAGVE